jgi:hypothetical protein
LKEKKGRVLLTILELTPEDIQAEYYAYQYLEEGEKEEYEDEEFSIEEILNDDWETVIDSSKSS